MTTGSDKLSASGDSIQSGLVNSLASTPALLHGHCFSRGAFHRSLQGSNGVLAALLLADKIIA